MALDTRHARLKCFGDPRWMSMCLGIVQRFSAMPRAILRTPPRNFTALPKIGKTFFTKVSDHEAKTL
jgi:hypothetical protein